MATQQSIASSTGSQHGTVGTDTSTFSSIHDFDPDHDDEALMSTDLMPEFSQKLPKLRDTARKYNRFGSVNSTRSGVKQPEFVINTSAIGRAFPEFSGGFSSDEALSAELNRGRKQKRSNNSYTAQYSGDTNSPAVRIGNDVHFNHTPQRGSMKTASIPKDALRNKQTPLEDTASGRLNIEQQKPTQQPTAQNYSTNSRFTSRSSRVEVVYTENLTPTPKSQPKATQVSTGDNRVDVEEKENVPPAPQANVNNSGITSRSERVEVEQKHNTSATQQNASSTRHLVRPKRAGVEHRENATPTSKSHPTSSRTNTRDHRVEVDHKENIAPTSKNHSASSQINTQDNRVDIEGKENIPPTSKNNANKSPVQSNQAVDANNATSAHRHNTKAKLANPTQQSFDFPGVPESSEQGTGIINAKEGVPVFSRHGRAETKNPSARYMRKGKNRAVDGFDNPMEEEEIWKMVDDLRDTVGQQQVIIGQLERDNNQLALEKRRMRDQADSVLDTNGGPALQAHAMALQKELDALKRTNASLEEQNKQHILEIAKFHKMPPENESLLRERNDAFAQLDSTREMNQRLRAERNELLGQLTDAQDHLRCAQEDNNHLRTENDNFFNELKALREQIQGLNEDAQQLEQDRDVMNMQNKRLSTQLYNAEQNVLKLKDTNEDLDHLRMKNGADLYTKDHEIAKLTKDNNELKQNIFDLKNEIQKLYQQLDARKVSSTRTSKVSTKSIQEDTVHSTHTVQSIKSNRPRSRSDDGNASDRSERSISSKRPQSRVVRIEQGNQADRPNSRASHVEHGNSSNRPTSRASLVEQGKSSNRPDSRVSHVEHTYQSNRPQSRSSHIEQISNQKSQMETQKSRDNATEYLAQDIEASFHEQNNVGKRPTLSSEARIVLDSLCKHETENCSKCKLIITNGLNKRQTMRVEKPIPTSSQENEGVGPSVAPGVALAAVIKSLVDEHSHLKVSYARAQSRYDEAQRNNKREERKALKKKLDALLLQMEVRADQLYNLYQVLEGQKQAGQEMTQDELDVTLIGHGIVVDEEDLTVDFTRSTCKSVKSTRSVRITRNVGNSTIGSTESLPWEGIVSR